MKREANGGNKGAANKYIMVRVTFIHPSLRTRSAVIVVMLGIVPLLLPLFWLRSYFAADEVFMAREGGRAQMLTSRWGGLRYAFYDGWSEDSPLHVQLGAGDPTPISVSPFGWGLPGD